MVTKKWVIENGEGHWQLSYKGMTLSCDVNELYTAEKEIIELGDNE